MTATLGRYLQLVGLVILPVGLYIGLATGDIRAEVRYLAIGGFVYLAGWILARRAE